ncbi:LysE family translocator [Aestuariivirga sp.]|uniref:LysE family translocator n=1 Tax=Aestuariivirga sp. TaxID=2650926 RepID=UPI003BAB723F
MDFLLLLTGMAIGLAVTAPLGPVNILIIRNAIRRGFGAAFLIGLGAVVADCFYAAAAAYGVSSIASFITKYAQPLALLGGLILVVMGVRLARKRSTGLGVLVQDTPVRSGQVAGRMLGAFTLTITNPGELFAFLAIFSAMNGVLRLHEDMLRPPTVVVGVALGGMAWWLFLSFIVSRFRERISETLFNRINRWTGVLIAAFGFALLMDAVF